MEHIAAFMLLIACSDDLQYCSEQPAPAVAYETMQQCASELSPAIRMTAAAKERVMGKCVEVDPAIFYEDAEIVWEVTQQGEIKVAIELINPELSIAAVAQSQPGSNENRYN